MYDLSDFLIFEFELLEKIVRLDEDCDYCFRLIFDHKSYFSFKNQQASQSLTVTIQCVHRREQFFVR